MKKRNYTIDYRRYSNVDYRYSCVFEEGKTENIMDYSEVSLSFWKHQWEAMQDDIVKFYNI